MSIYQHLTDFTGKLVRDWDPQEGIQDAQNTIYRLSLEYDESENGQLWTDKFALFLDDPSSSGIEGIVIGDWGVLSSQGTENNADLVVEALVAAHDRLPELRAIFFGDIISEQCEISWIQQTDVSPLLGSYPALEHFCVRGGERLSLGSLRHDRLKSLILQTGGLHADVVQQVAQAQLPVLEHLELWLGEDNYGGNTRIDDLEPILAGHLFPKLQYLGLRDSMIADEIAVAVATAPVLEKIRVLDLSLGMLSDVGAEALLASPAIARLEKLDLHHHFCSEEMIKRLAAFGPKVDVSDRQEPSEYHGETWRYVAVGE